MSSTERHANLPLAAKSAPLRLTRVSRPVTLAIASGYADLFNLRVKEQTRTLTSVLCVVSSSPSAGDDNAGTSSKKK